VKRGFSEPKANKTSQDQNRAALALHWQSTNACERKSMGNPSRQICMYYYI